MRRNLFPAWPMYGACWSSLTTHGAPLSWQWSRANPVASTGAYPKASLPQIPSSATAGPPTSTAHRRRVVIHPDPVLPGAHATQHPHQPTSRPRLQDRQRTQKALRPTHQGKDCRTGRIGVVGGHGTHVVVDARIALHRCYRGLERLFSYRPLIHSPTWSPRSWRTVRCCAHPPARS